MPQLRLIVQASCICKFRKFGAMCDHQSRVLVPGLQKSPAWPEGVYVQPTLTPDERRLKRQGVLNVYKKHADYQIMAFIRANKEYYEIPAGELPQTPNVTPRNAKRQWERHFMVFKQECQTWADWVEQGKARPKPRDHEEKQILQQNLSELLSQLETNERVDYSSVHWTTKAQN